MRTKNIIPILLECCSFDAKNPCKFCDFQESWFSYYEEFVISLVTHFYFYSVYILTFIQIYLDWDDCILILYWSNIHVLTI